jgi:two-component system sensor histidine kinase ChiS
MRCLASLAILLLATSDVAARPKPKPKPKPKADAKSRAEPAAVPREGQKTVEGAMPGPLRFGRMGSEEGLPTEGVFAIAQDGRGFLYFGTRTGLARYDGHEMKVLLHDPKNPSSLPSSDISALATDRAGRLWVGTDAGLSMLDPVLDTFIHIRDEKQDPTGRLGQGINELFVDSGDTLWTGLKSGGVARIECRTGAVRMLPLLAETELSSVAQQAAGPILLGSRGEGVLVYDPKAERVLARYTSGAGSQVRLPSDEVSAVHVDEAGRTWIGTMKNGLVSVDKAGKVVTYAHKAGDRRSLSDDSVTAIFAGPDRSVWIGTERGGLNRHDEKAGGFTQYTGDPSDRDRLSLSDVTVGAMTRDGVVWVGTPAGEVNYFDALGLAFNYYRSGGTAIMSIVEDATRPDIFWMGSAPGVAQSGLYRVDTKSGSYTHLLGLRAGTQLLDLNQGWISALHSDRKGTIWIGTQGLGLIEYRPEGEIVVQHRVSSEDGTGEDGPGNVYAIAEGPDGALWIGTWGHGLAKFTPATGEVEHFAADPNDPNSISSDHIYTIARDVKDERFLWVGTGEGGLNHFDTTRGAATRYLHERDNPSTLSNNNVTTIHQEASGRVWVGTFGGGLNRFDMQAGTWKRYDQADHPSTVFGILDDGRGSLWLSTNGEGLKKLDPKTDQMIGYSARDGLQADEFAQGGFHRGASGRLYFGGTRGATVFRPETIPSSRFTPPVILTEFRVFDKARPVPADQAVKLSYLDSVVSFQFAALEFSDPRRVRYDYRLSGLDDRWTATREHSVTYADLDPGSYVFELRARGRHGAPTSAALAVPFEISPPPWRTWWAYGIYGLSGLLVILAFVQYQRRKIVRIEQQNRLAAVEREIELTAAVHSGFLPSASQVEDDGFGLVGVYRPAGQCSGDWWWHERLNGHVHLIACGDVTGHGPGPAMVTASVSTTFRVMRSVWAESGPKEFLRIANEQVMASGRGRYLMQIMVAEFDTRSGELAFYSAAGFPAVCLLGGQFKIFTARGVPLGTPSFDVTEVKTTLSPGDRFMLLTDGIPEIELDNGRRLGLRRLTKIYEETAAMPLSEAAAHVLAAAESANHKREQEDDWTFVIAEWARRTEGRRPAAAAARL